MYDCDNETAFEFVDLETLFIGGNKTKQVNRKKKTTKTTKKTT